MKKLMIVLFTFTSFTIYSNEDIYRSNKFIPNIPKLQKVNFNLDLNKKQKRFNNYQERLSEIYPFLEENNELKRVSLLFDLPLSYDFIFKKIFLYDSFLSTLKKSALEKISIKYEIDLTHLIDKYSLLSHSNDFFTEIVINPFIDSEFGVELIKLALVYDIINIEDIKIFMSKQYI